MERPGPSADSLDWYTGERERVASRLRELLGDRAGGVQDLWRYHMGWTDEHGRPVEAETGKMLRPVLCLTACAGYGDSTAVVTIAAAIELLHAFSLAHDDIEDGDRERRHRPTLWAQFGIPLAVNAGDGLFALAGDALYEGIADLDRARGLQVLRLFSAACLGMIEGQHVDIEFESRPSVALAGYEEMVRGKTGAIIGAALAIGAVCGGAGASDVDRLREAGVELGLAFQATDDVLAFWGDPAETGKAVGNDLARGKKSLPVVLAAERGLSLDTLRGMPLADVLHELERFEAGARSEQFAREHALAARKSIGATGMSEVARERLTSLIDFSVARAH